MGTRVVKFVVLLIVIGLGCASLAWAKPAPEEEVALPAPVVAQPSMIAQAPDAAPAEAPAAAPETLGVTQNATGVAYYYNDRDWEVWASIGDISGLRPTAQVEFVRNGQVVATGTVKQVRDVDCIITPAKGTPAGAILKGDVVRVTLNGTRHALNKQMAEERRWELLGEIVFGALVWAPYNK